MIHKVDMYAMTCDGCGEDLGAISEYSGWAEISSLKDDAEGHDWMEVDGKYYCLDCYEVNGHGNVVIIKKEEK